MQALTCRKVSYRNAKKKKEKKRKLNQIKQSQNSRTFGNTYCCKYHGNNSSYTEYCWQNFRCMCQFVVSVDRCT